MALALPWKHLSLYMIDLRTRSYKKELLDEDGVSFADIRQNMKELNTINTFLSGHSISVSGLQKILNQHNSGTAITVCEIGCGGGDNLLALAKWCKHKNIPVNFIGIDIKPACIEFAKRQCSALTVQWIAADYLQVNLSNNKPDVIYSSLFCHHFKEAGLVTMLQWMKQNAAKGFFINDLQRHFFAYYSIKFITTLFSESYLVKNDAPLSVARGFKKKEWQQLLQQAGIENYTLQWRWAFRYLITYHNG